MTFSKACRVYFYLNYIRLEKLAFWFEHRVTLKGWFLFWTTLVVVFPSLNIRFSMAYQMTAMGICFFFVATLSLRRFKPKLTLNRQLPEITRVGQDMCYVLSITNEMSTTIDGVLCHDVIDTPFPDREKFLKGYHKDKRNIFDRFMGYPRFQAMMHRLKPAIIKPLQSLSLPAKQTMSFKVNAKFNQRGHHIFYGTKVMREESLGLMCSSTTFKLKDSIWVFPALWKGLNWKPGWLTDLDSQIQMTKQKKGDPEILHYLREYQVSDSPKYIHWKSSAKLDRFMVKNFLQEKGDAYGLILDTFYESEDLNRWEAMLSWLSTCLNAQLGLQLEIEILFFGELIEEMKFDGSLTSWKNTMKKLATLEPQSIERKLASKDKLLKYMRSKRTWIWLGIDHGPLEQSLWKDYYSAGKRFQGTFIHEPGEPTEKLPYLLETTCYEIGSNQPIKKRMRA